MCNSGETGGAAPSSAAVSAAPTLIKPELSASTIAAIGSQSIADFQQQQQQQRQLYDYAACAAAAAAAAAGRLRAAYNTANLTPYQPHQHPYVPAMFAAAAAAGLYPAAAANAAVATPLTTPHHPLAAAMHHPFAKFDPRMARFVHEEPKPQHSYIGLIAMAILSSPEHKMVLSEIYQYILDNYPYFRNRGPGWRNSIRHNLSLNDCFVKAGRSANGKGHYWAVHPANVDDFQKGDFRRRKAQRKVRKHMGLSVPDDDDSPSPPPAPVPTPAAALWRPIPTAVPVAPVPIVQANRRRQFDVESLLAPDRVDDRHRKEDEGPRGESDDEMRATDDEEASKNEDGRWSSPTWGANANVAAAVAAMAAHRTAAAAHGGAVFWNPLAAAAAVGFSRTQQGFQQQQQAYRNLLPTHVPVSIANECSSSPDRNSDSP